MKKARNRKEQDVLEAANLHLELQRRKSLGHCLPVSLKALGGAVHTYHVLKKSERMASLSTVDDYGLLTGYFIDVFTKIDIEYLEGLMHLLATETINESYTDFTGILVHISFEGEKSKHNHYLAIIPRDLLSQKLQRQLKRENAHLVIDTSSKPVVGRVIMQDLLEYINGMIEHGAGIGFMQIFKETD